MPFPVTGFAGQLNSGMVLPDWLSGVGQWMRDKEDYADHLLDLIMTPETFAGMFLNIIIIAAIPAIGEELIFRGVFQKIFQNLFRSGHLSVWFTSFLFSAIHFQFLWISPKVHSRTDLWISLFMEKKFMASGYCSFYK